MFGATSHCATAEGVSSIRYRRTARRRARKRLRCIYSLLREKCSSRESRTDVSIRSARYSRVGWRADTSIPQIVFTTSSGASRISFRLVRTTARRLLAGQPPPRRSPAIISDRSRFATVGGYVRVRASRENGCAFAGEKSNQIEIKRRIITAVLKRDGTENVVENARIKYK